VVNLLLGETTLVVSDGDAARLASCLVGGRDVQNTVSINVEGNFNLWNTTRSRRNARQLKLAEELVVLGASTLSFVYLNKYTRLVVSNNKDSRAEL
jgi:NAD-specific glutamate dehydrogenase